MTAAKDANSDPSRLATGVRAWLSGAPLRPDLAALLGLALPALLYLFNAWRMRAFTIDDAYISYRYARNLARGEGLVYNVGERIEGYTNFLWTVLLAGGIRLGVDPDLLAKVLGAGCGVGVLWATYLLSKRFRPFGTVPCLTTWLLASSIVFGGYSVFGLETSLFMLLVVGGLEFMFREVAANDSASPPSGLRALPASGAVFGLAALTRPEAPMFLGVPMLLLGTKIWGRQNLVRALLFAVPLGLHTAWRRSYYGTWLPNTLSAKTGGQLADQVRGGVGYVEGYVAHAGPFVWLAFLGAAIAIVSRRRDLLATAALAACVVAYVCLVGGDWMPFFRFMAPFEPFCFLLVDVAARTVVERRERATTLAVAAFAVAMGLHRNVTLREAQAKILLEEHRFWRKAAGGTANWLLANGAPGEIAIGDIGYVGWKTDYPVLDLLGLVDPVISKLPGGYTRKLGPGFTERFFDKAPTYALIISSDPDCRHPSVPGSQVLYRDARFKDRYDVAGTVLLDHGFAWCIYRRK